MSYLCLSLLLWILSRFLDPHSYFFVPTMLFMNFICLYNYFKFDSFSFPSFINFLNTNSTHLFLSFLCLFKNIVKLFFRICFIQKYIIIILKKVNLNTSASK
jgi:hypothetical protein